MILEAAFSEHAYILWTVLWITAGLTAFYSFRLVMLVFHGEEKYHKYGYHPHETYAFVIAAMTPLAILAIIAGWFEHSFVEMVTQKLPAWHGHLDHSTEYILIAVTSAVAIFGIAVAVYKYRSGGFSRTWEYSPFYKLLKNQYFIPKFYDVVFSKPYLAISKFSWKEIDLKIVDTIVDTIAKAVYTTGTESRVIQTGNLSKALKWMVVGITILLVLAVALGSLK
jgi:NADH-quinone oxidoreductase subunit L